jgi:hypothetical protein
MNLAMPFDKDQAQLPSARHLAVSGATSIGEQSRTIGVLNDGHSRLSKLGEKIELSRKISESTP